MFITLVFPLHVQETQKLLFKLARELKLINLGQLLDDDSDLAGIDPFLLPLCLIFSQLGKATFMRYFFQGTWFITAVGSLL